jgi:hypothetical protein
MSTTEAEPSSHFDRTDRLMISALRSMKKKYNADEPVTIRDLLEPLGARSTALGAAMLALPFLSPISLGPLTMPASVVIALLGWYLLLDRDNAPLPERLLNTPVPRRIHSMMGVFARKIFSKVRRWTKPRARHLVDGRKGLVICGVGMIISAIILAVPVPMLPLTNTFPALAIVLIILGWTERDGGLTIAGYVNMVIGGVLILAVVGIVAWGLMYGWGAVHDKLPWLEVPEKLQHIGSNATPTPTPIPSPSPAL